MDVNYIPDVVLTAALEMRELPECEASYELIATLDKRTLFADWLQYNGIIGYADEILQILARLNEAETISQQ